MKFSLSTSDHQAPPTVPMVYVTETVQWEYKQITVEIVDGELWVEEVLNELGAEGWKLTAVCPLDITVNFYFERLKR